MGWERMEECGEEKGEGKEGGLGRRRKRKGGGRDKQDQV